MPDQDLSPAAALAALRDAEHAQQAARSRPPAPAWYAPARGLLFVATFALLLGPWSTPVTMAGVAATIAFIGVHAVAANRGGVIVVKRRTRKEWFIDQGVPAIAFGLGWLAAIPFGHPGGAVASAVFGGIAMWIVTAWAEGRGVRA